MTRRGLTSRRLQPELMDDPLIDPGEHRAALRGLARLNKASRIAAVIERQIHEVAGNSPVRVLDVAAGSGDLVVALAKRASKTRRPWSFAACDISETACEAIERRAADAGVSVAVSQADILAASPEGEHDIVMCHLFLHHLLEGDAQAAIVNMSRVAGRSLIMTDLIRSRTGFALAYLASRFLTTSRVVRCDALRSVEGALSVQEMAGVLAAAGCSGARIRRVWPGRMLIRCDA